MIKKWHLLLFIIGSPYLWVFVDFSVTGSAEWAIIWTMTLHTALIVWGLNCLFDSHSLGVLNRKLNKDDQKE